jgi:hypothetical protein
MRDFRDAKAMAHSLRDGLQAKAVKTTHSECLELIARAFGLGSWNILSAKIEADRSPAPALAPAAAQDQATQQAVLYCSFCGKSQHDVRTLIAGPAVFVCDECVGACDDIIEDREIWNLLEADEAGGHHAYPAALDYLRAKPIDDVVACRVRSRRGVERQRLHLQDVQRQLALRGAEGAAAEELASPLISHLRNKPREELLVIERHAERDMKRYETMLRVVTAVLEDRRKV